MFGKKRRLQGRLAAGLYGEWTDSEQEEVLKALQADASLSSEYDALTNLVKQIPRDSVTPPIDILPRVRATLCESQVSTRTYRWRTAWATATLVLLTGAVAFYFDMNAKDPVVGSRAPAASVVSLLEEARSLENQRDFANAAKVLEATVETYPKDALSGEALQRLADMRFEQMQDYAGAYKAYLELREQHYDTWRSGSGNAPRLDLLDEMRHYHFEPLEMLDLARAERSGALPAMEHLLARYACTEEFAPMVAREMARLAGVEGIEPATQGLKAYEQVRDRCQDPVAVARLNLELGRLYLLEKGDRSAAVSLGREALAGPDPGVKALAQVFLDELAAVP